MALEPSGPHLCQNLNLIVIGDYESLLDSVPVPPFDPYNGQPPIYDPSSPGPPESWGGRILDPSTDPPTTGTTIGTRVPGTGPGGSGPPPQRRKGGRGVPPSPNTLTFSPGVSGPRSCFVGQLRVRITNPAPDFGGWNGQQPSLFGAACLAYNPPTIPAPSTALVMRTILANPLGLSNEVAPVGTLLLDVFRRHLAVNVGANSSAEVIEDFWDGPSGSCSGTSGVGCGGTITPSSHVGTAIGTIIYPA